MDLALGAFLHFILPFGVVLLVVLHFIPFCKAVKELIKTQREISAINKANKNLTNEIALQFLKTINSPEYLGSFCSNGKSRFTLAFYPEGASDILKSKPVFEVELSTNATLPNLLLRRFAADISVRCDNTPFHVKPIVSPDKKVRLDIRLTAKEINKIARERLKGNQFNSGGEA